MRATDGVSALLEPLLLGAGIGLAAGLSPGPVLTLVVAETARGGWRRGSAVAAGPLLADGPIIALALLVATSLPGEAVRLISLVGAAFLFYLAGATALRVFRPHRSGERQLSARGGLLKGLLARGLGPHPYLFWFLVGTPLLAQAAGEFFLTGVAAFLFGYYSTLVGSNVVLAMALHRWARDLPERLYRLLLATSALLLAAFGVMLLRA